MLLHQSASTECQTELWCWQHEDMADDQRYKGSKYIYFLTVIPNNKEISNWTIKVIM